MPTTICYCFNVSEEDIETRIDAGATLADVCSETGMGYACGGCNYVAEPLWGENATDESRERIKKILAHRAELITKDMNNRDT